MTLREFREETADLPEDTVICMSPPFPGIPYWEAVGIDIYDNEDYHDTEDQPKKGNIIVI